MLSQWTKERKAKENLVVLHNGSPHNIKFDGGIWSRMCPVLSLLSKSKD